MPKRKNDTLLKLIRRLSKAEKRYFKLLVIGNNKENHLYVKLFDHLDKNNHFDKNEILKKIPEIKPSQLANLKASLYKKLLDSLSRQMVNSQESMKMRQQMDFATVLYSKGMYRESLNTIQKAKKYMLSKHKYTFAQLLIEMEKHIEAFYITGSKYPKADDLVVQSNKVLSKMKVENELSNLSISLYGLYLNTGYVKSQQDVAYVSSYFKNKLKDIDEEELSFYSKMNLYQSYVWYYNMIQNFAFYYRYAQKWLDLFLDNPDHIAIDTNLCIKGYHNVLNGLFMCNRLEKFKNTLERFKNIQEYYNLKFSTNQLSQFKLFEKIHDINLIYLNGKYETNLDLANELSSLIIHNPYNWDEYRLLMFDYKVACLYFGANALDKCLFHLNRIINNVKPEYRGDIQCFARILSLITHYDLGNDLLVGYQIRSTYRFIIKMENVQKVHKEIFGFLRKTTKMNTDDLIEEFIKLKEKLIILKKDPFERRPFLYLDIISWLDSKINGITMAQAIRKNMIKPLIPIDSA